MKTLYLVGGTMGVGKTTVCLRLKQKLDNAVFLDGDWCWNADPFHVTEETKKMVLENICFLLNQFLRCSVYDNVIFCWVMHEQYIIDSILGALDCEGVHVKTVSLMCLEKTLIERLSVDVDAGIRSEDVIARSTARLSFYENLNTVRIPTDGKTVDEIADDIISAEGNNGNIRY